ncbi:CPBP family intramembrane glutamic endopeptidase [Chloroflexota bacterium]
MAARAGRTLRHLRKPELLIVPAAVLAAVAMRYLGANATRLLPLSVGPDPDLGSSLSYQVMTLGLAVVFVLGVRLFKPKNYRRFARRGEIGAEFRSMPQIGLTSGPGETWLQVGRNMAVIIAIVTVVVVWLQSGRSVHLASGWPVLLLWALLFALMNSFTEEAIFRFGVVGFLHGALPNGVIFLLSGILFGVAHYHGMPAGVGGVFLAGFLGWFLAKSMVETRGVFWAWLIHFVLDVVVFVALFVFVTA